MVKRHFKTLANLGGFAVLWALATACHAALYEEVETKLRPLATPLAKPEKSDWLANHKEDGQTFAEYVAAKPIRKGHDGRVIYILPLGDFTAEQNKVLETTKEYLQVFYQVPVRTTKSVDPTRFPAEAKRDRPQYGEQLLTTHVLDNVLKPNRPQDALAYLAFTARDLYPEPSWNFVFGQASLRDRTGVWSIARQGDPSAGDAAYRKCLRRVLHTASHETGHILSIKHCTAFDCNMNGVNSLDESDRKPLTMCPVCLRKVCWNLQVDPPTYVAKLESFCKDHELTEEAKWYAQAGEALRAK